MNNKSKTKNSALVALFTLTLLILGATLQSAHASEASTADVDILVNEMTLTQSKISNLDVDTVSNTVEIDALNEKFWVMNDLINTVTNVEPERDFLSEWISLEEKQDGLENTLIIMNDLGVSGGIDQVLHSQITQIDRDIEQLRQESIKSMILDPTTQSELMAIQDRIHLEYPHITDSAIDSIEKKVLVLVDYEVPTNTDKTLHMLKTFGTDKVMVEDLPELIGCTKTTKKCDPALGGLAIVRPDEADSRGFSGSIGYKTTNINGTVGFVTAGHVADWSTASSSVSSNSVINFYDGTKLGDVTEAYGTESSARSDGKKHVDVAFVQTNKITDDVFLHPNIKIDTVSYADSKSDHVKGDFIYRIGAASGYQKYSTIYYVLRDSSVIIFSSIDTQKTLLGDSGGTIFQKDSQHRAIVLGHMIKVNQYVPVHTVKDLYGITPMTR